MKEMCGCINNNRGQTEYEIKKYDGNEEDSNLKAKSGKMISIIPDIEKRKEWVEYDTDEKVSQRISVIHEKFDLKIKQNGWELFTETQYEEFNFNEKINQVRPNIELSTTHPREGLNNIKRGPVYFVETNDIYYGEWDFLTVKKNGYGKWKSSNKCYYEGYFVNGVMSGEGFMIDPNGNYYKGTILIGKADGYGEYIRSDGSKLSGQWKNDLMNGKGKEIFEGGNYEGDYINGEKNGYGVLEMTDGSRYEGQFRDNQINGQGTFKWKDGRSYTGSWENSKMHGRGVFIFSDGRKYDGEYINDIKEGKGRYYWNDEKYYEGEFLNGKRHGEGVIINKDKIIKGKWNNGNLIKDKEFIKTLDPIQN